MTAITEAWLEKNSDDFEVLQIPSGEEIRYRFTYDEDEVSFSFLEVMPHDEQWIIHNAISVDGGKELQGFLGFFESVEDLQQLIDVLIRANMDPIKQELQSDHDIAIEQLRKDGVIQ